MKRDIFQMIQDKRETVSFAMPGHKHRGAFDFTLYDDTTEVIGADNLLNPEGCILESERRLAALYGAEESYYITEGSTQAMRVALSMLTRRGDRILMQRNSHKSVYNAVIQMGLEPDYLFCKYDAEHGVLLGVMLDDLEAKLKSDLGIRAVVITSPDYFGLIQNIKAIAELVHRYGVRLIVDEAHGAHLAFTSLKGLSAVPYADCTVQSTHKTMPALTGSALLHTNGIPRDRCIKHMAFVMSTSPSYLSMLSSEYAVAYCDANREGFSRAAELIHTTAEHLNGAIEVLRVRDESIVAVDPMKLVFRTRGCTGLEIENELSIGYNIDLEMGDLNYALAMVSPLNTPGDFRALEAAIREVSRGDFLPIATSYRTVAPWEAMPMDQGFFAPSEYIDIDEAEGRIAANMIMLYPPGTPIVAPGEVFTKDVLTVMGAHRRLIGVKEGKCEVVCNSL
ncbi:aminotransferase class I/II-fold pyridoxal phosphate-dependent enzyme [Peptoniphilus equinus]|uniref:Aminotransferase class I/II-fold pyridoxal phosphate-dependent enzyme n=1 Tax=Peptoniphilus equinus TaxID=3016343 RepID=A0ABY7QSI2_9FIRM|nr:aminotransferase class I/II-fold pyridoxal phosphate-dependent enzyme [Peptoniphilus equinus]WBW49761.1 aminotransferase class I/II-fold pyridoxal phosphate-dependent enzyme [Peptoniphilus equinus]